MTTRTSGTKTPFFGRHLSSLLRSAAVAAAFLAWLAAGCADSPTDDASDEDAGSGAVCTAGETRTCACEDGGTGMSTCLADESGWSRCDCGDARPVDTGSTGDTQEVDDAQEDSSTDLDGGDTSPSETDAGSDSGDTAPIDTGTDVDTGTEADTAEDTGTDADACQPRPEFCNLEDDDCDGMVDEGLNCECSDFSLNVCVQDEQNCENSLQEGITKCQNFGCTVDGDMSCSIGGSPSNPNCWGGDFDCK